MNFIKKKLFLIISSVVFLLGIALFVHAVMINKENTAKHTSIKSEYEQIAKLGREAVRTNVLNHYQENARLKREDAHKVAELAIRTTSRPLIYEKVFPKPWEESSRTIYYRRFAERYCQSIDKLIKDELNGGDRPSPIEENVILQEHRKRSVEGSASRRVGGGFGFGGGGTTGKGSRDTSEYRLIDDLRLTKAGSISIYANPDVFCCYEYWKDHPGTGDWEAMLSDSWFSQIALWIQEDVALSVGELNSSNASVLENPVKRLIEITFAGVQAGKGMDQKSSKKTSDSIRRIYDGGFVTRRENNSELILPDYVIREIGLKDEKGRMTGNMGTSLTDRVCNELVDIVHFELVVVIDNTRVIDFVNALQSVKGSAGDSGVANERNQITVLDMRIEPVETEEEKAAGYHYGTASLGITSLICEYVFFKGGYEKYKPEPVKELLVEEEDNEDSGQSGSRNR